MSDDAYSQFNRLRWPPDGKPVCPRCGSAKSYILSTRGTFKCRCCKKHYSATSGTILAGHKMSYGVLLAFIESKHLNALKLSQETGVQYKVAWVMCSKLREMYAAGRSIGDQIDATIKGYFQRGQMPDPTCCERCRWRIADLRRATFRLDRKCSGYYCPKCYADLTEAEAEFRGNYEELRMIKEFEEGVNGINQKHG